MTKYYKTKYCCTCDGYIPRKEIHEFDTCGICGEFLCGSCGNDFKTFTLEEGLTVATNDCKLCCRSCCLYCMNVYLHDDTKEDVNTIYCSDCAIDVAIEHPDAEWYISTLPKEPKK